MVCTIMLFEKMHFRDISVLVIGAIFAQVRLSCHSGSELGPVAQKLGKADRFGEFSQVQS